MDLFEEIDKVKEDLPKLNKVSDEVNKIKLNMYQKITVVIFIICLFLGILFGNLFPSCGSSSEFYSNVCVTTEFNFSLMLFIWFISFIFCLLLFMIGHVILLLSEINKNLVKKNKNKLQ